MKALLHAVPAPLLAPLFTILLLATPVTATDWSAVGPDTLNVTNYRTSEMGPYLDLLSTTGGLCLNGGSDWEVYPSGLPCWDITDWSADTLLVLLGIGTFSDGIYRFNTSSHEFTVEEYCYIPNFFFRYGGTRYAGCQSGLLKWDEAEGWTPIADFLNIPCLDMAGWGGHLAVSVAGNIPGVYTSDDGGVSWTPPQPGTPYISNMAFDQEGVLYGIFPDSSWSSGLWKSLDYGVTWEVVFWSIDLADVFVVDRYVIVAWRHSYLDYEGVELLVPETGELIPMNEGLPCLSINRLSTNDLVDCYNVIACTEQGAWFTCDFPEVDVGEPPAQLPAGFALTAYPTPFNSTLRVSVTLPGRADLRITLLNLLGREVAVIREGRVSEGAHSYAFRAGGLSSGIYLLRATVPGRMDEVRKVVLLR
ncbi:MAG TPA: T9SS type A sorting domain-containing protein [Bacteroidetes bacterium]|nr:T9SS type A sorting domain-containing protein [Bacteroidota bacterium]